MSSNSDSKHNSKAFNVHSLRNTLQGRIEQPKTLQHMPRIVRLSFQQQNKFRRSLQHQ